MYYDGTRTLGLLDRDGLQPEIYMISSPRGTGKTTYFNSLVLKNFLVHGEKWIQLVRFKNELTSFNESYYSQAIQYTPELADCKVRVKPVGHQKYSEITVNDQLAGFVIPINSAEYVRRVSHIFSGCSSILFEEFQSESELYCSNEIIKFQSIHASVARGWGQMYRRVPVYMLSNPVSLLNPYFVLFDLCDKINNNTKIYRGHGLIVENYFSDEISEAYEDSAFSRAIGNGQYSRYLSTGKYLNDYTSFITKMEGKNTYIATIIYKSKKYAMRYYKDSDTIYWDKRVDNSFKLKISLTVDDHDFDSVFNSGYSPLKERIRQYFNMGRISFADQECRTAAIKYIV